MTIKIVPIQTKMKKPTLSEVVSRLESLLTNFTTRGEDRKHIILTTLSFSISQLQREVVDDEKMLDLIDCILDQYIDIPDDESYVSLVTPDKD